MSEPAMPHFLELVGAGKLSMIDVVDMLYKSNAVKYTIAVLLALLLAFEHDVHIFSEPITFWVLLVITVAMTFTELIDSPGLILLMTALTVISFNLSVSRITSSEH